MPGARNVVITGASTGIGEACARHLDGLGWRVFAGVRRDADAERLRAGCSDRLTPVTIDVTDEAGVASAFAEISAAVGADGLHGLVNNAGVARGGPIEFLPLDEWREQFEVNVVGHLSVTKAALASVRVAKGRIVFIGSISGRVAAPLVGPYSASKHAIEAIGATLRQELRPWGLEVSVVEPGVIKTPIWAKGRTSARAMDEVLGAEAVRLYGDQMDTVRSAIDKNDRRGVEAVEVAKAVDHALSAARPKHRYLVGTDAKVAGNLSRIVPDRLWSSLSRRLLAL